MLYDISVGMLKTKPYPGDPKCRVEKLSRIDMGDEYNLTTIYTCTHTGTHIDAPSHYIQDGDTVEKLPLDIFTGECSVVSIKGLVTGADIDIIMRKAKERILFRGNGRSFLSESAVFALVGWGIRLVGIDAVSIAMPDDETVPHCGLLMHGIPIIECLDLSDVEDGDYILYAFPIKLDGLEAAPVRAVLEKRD